jgi:hypothetical protein
MFRAMFSRSHAATSAAGLDGLMFSSRMTRSSTVGLSSSCWTARCRSTGSIELTPRRSSGESVGDCIPIVARDRYFFGHTASTAAPATMHTTSGTMNHHLRRFATDR